MWSHTSASFLAPYPFVNNDGQVIAICGRNSGEREAYMCFFDSFGQIVRSYPRERLFFMSPDGKVLLTSKNKVRTFFDASTGEKFGHSENFLLIRSFSDSGAVGVKNNQLYTIRQNGELLFHNQEIEEGYLLELVSRDGNSFLAVNRKKKMTMLYTKSDF